MDEKTNTSASTPDKLSGRAAVSSLLKQYGMPVAVAVLTALVVIAYMAVLVEDRNAAVAERDVLRAEAQRAEAAQDVLLAMLQTASENEEPSTQEAFARSFTVRDVVENGLQKINAEADEPLAQAAMLSTLGQACVKFGLFDVADSLYREALAVQRVEQGHANLDLTSNLILLAIQFEHRYEFARGEELLRLAYEARRERWGKNHPAVFEAMNQLAYSLYMQDENEEARQLHNEVLEVEGDERERALPEVAMAYTGLAMLHEKADSCEEAEPLHREALAIRLRTIGYEHSYTGHSMFGIAKCLRERGERQEAEKYYRNALEIYRSVHGDLYPTVAVSVYSLALLAHEAQRYEEAEKLYQEADSIYQASLAPSHAWRALPLMGLGRLLLERDRPEEAEPFFRASLKIYKQKLDTSDVRIARAHRELGRSLTMQRRYAEAEAALKHSLALLPEGKSERDERARTLRSLIGLYEAWSKKDEASSYQALLEQSNRKSYAH